ncbi:response regulator [Pseudoduganella sp. RAF19]|jgi:two-component system chemotaxis response regulator CheY|uniref:response regulator n=1 Tax=Pseudoduganella sp. RAF19 TaxID=3233052 RepID=UPI003F9DF71A
MLKAVIIDVSAVARGLLNTVLTDGGYDVVGQAHTCATGNALLIKHHPQIICVSRDVIEADEAGMQAMRKDWPKAMIFMVSSEFDEATIRKGHAMGLNGYIVKPFNAGTVLKTIRNTVITTVKRQQKAQGAGEGESVDEA